MSWSAEPPRRGRARRAGAGGALAPLRLVRARLFLVQRFLVAGVLMALALSAGGCGFTPLYGTGGAAGPEAAAALADVHVETIPDRAGQQLRNLLIGRFHPHGRPARPRHALTVQLTETTSGLGVLRDATVARGEIRLTARFALLDRVTGETLLDGTSRVIGTYNVLESEYATLISEREARERGLAQIARELEVRIAGFFRHPRPQPPAEPGPAASGRLAPGDAPGGFGRALGR